MKLPEAERSTALSSAIHERNEEAKTWKTKFKQVNNPKANQLLESLKIRFGVEEVDEAFLEMLEKRNTQGQSQEEQMKALKAQLERESNEKKSLNEKLKASEIQQRERQRDEAILGALTKAGIHRNSADAKKIIITDAVYDGDTGKWTFDGKDLDGYVSEFAKDRPHFVDNPVKGGSGNSSSSNNGHGSGSADFISEAEYMAMSPEDQRANHKKAMVSMVKW
jgi:hypothetical protein